MIKVEPDTNDDKCHCGVPMPVSRAAFRSERDGGGGTRGGRNGEAERK